MAEMLKNASWTNFKIYGNADSTGPAEYNQTLSENRANTVKDYLVSKGLPAEKITKIGNGEEKPIATNDTPEGRQKNRRVDFEIIK
jgi:outer membrane protein OmpA-like peptidoglycan-associated protein